MRKVSLFCFFLFLSMCALAQSDYVRLKGYYRTYQYTDSVLTHVVDGMMEFFIPTDGKGEFGDRKILGERLQSDGSDGTLLRMGLPNLEVKSLMKSIEGDEYSLRNNGDVYLMDKLAGHITKTGSLTTITMDELTGRPNHELDMSQLRLMGCEALMTEFVESESYASTSNSPVYDVLTSATKHQSFVFRLNGDDQWHKANVVSEFYVTDHAIISKKEKRYLMHTKNKVWEFLVPSFVVPIAPRM